MRKVPMRKCVITQEQFPKKELLRIVKTPTGDVEIDESGKKNGRGAYIKKSKDVVTLAKKNNALSRALECKIPDEIYDTLVEMFNE